MRANTGATMSFYQQARLLPRPEAGPATGQPQNLPAQSGHGSARPRVLRTSAGWWDAPPVVGCPLSLYPPSAAAARRLTRDTLQHWGLPSLAEDAELIVGELVANAITHGARSVSDCKPGQENPRLRLRRRAGEVICAVLDPSDTIPVLKAPGCAEQSGRGLQIVDVLSDVWGWSPIAGRGKAVWAVLF